MKTFGKLLAIAMIAIASLSTTAFAQEGGGSGGDKNIRFGPLGLAVGVVNVQMDFKLNNEWTLGPSVAFVNWEDDDSVYTNDIEISGYSFGARANWFNNGVFTDGFYIGPALHYTSIEAKVNDGGTEFKADGSVLVASSIFGYGWFWESFNILLGGGIAIPLGDKEVTIKENGVETESVRITSSFAAEFTLGWTF